MSLIKLKHGFHLRILFSLGYKGWSGIMSIQACGLSHVQEDHITEHMLLYATKNSLSPR